MAGQFGFSVHMGVDEHTVILHKRNEKPYWSVYGAYDRLQGPRYPNGKGTKRDSIVTLYNRHVQYYTEQIERIGCNPEIH